jgi:hypothetical protein
LDESREIQHGKCKSLPMKLRIIPCLAANGIFAAVTDGDIWWRTFAAPRFATPGHHLRRPTLGVERPCSHTPWVTYNFSHGRLVIGINIYVSVSPRCPFLSYKHCFFHITALFAS